MYKMKSRKNVALYFSAPLFLSAPSFKCAVKESTVCKCKHLPIPYYYSTGEHSLKGTNLSPPWNSRKCPCMVESMIGLLLNDIQRQGRTFDRGLEKKNLAWNFLCIHHIILILDLQTMICLRLLFQRYKLKLHRQALFILKIKKHLKNQKLYVCTRNAKMSSIRMPHFSLNIPNFKCITFDEISN